MIASVPSIRELSERHPGACCVCGERPADLFSFSLLDEDGNEHELRACPEECAFDLGILVVRADPRVLPWSPDLE